MSRMKRRQSGEFSPLPPESAPLPDEFNRGCADNTAAAGKKRKKWAYYAAAFALFVCILALGEVKPEAKPQLPEPPAAGTEVPVTASPAPGSAIYFAYINGSYCVADAVIAEPQSVSAVKVEAIDARDGETLEEFILTREEIDAGHWSASFLWTPQDFAAYESRFGVGALPIVELHMSLERDDEVEEYSADKSCGFGPELLYDFDAEKGLYGVRLTGSGIENAELVFILNGAELLDGSVAVTDGTEEITVSRPGEEPSVEQREYRKFTASLPQAMQDGDSLSFILRIELGGHQFEYTEKIL